MLASVRMKPSVVAMRGWIMPEPLVMPAMRMVPRCRLRIEAERLLGDQVGGHDGAGDVCRNRSAETLRPGAGELGDEIGIEFDADDAGGGGQNVWTGLRRSSFAAARQQASGDLVAGAGGAIGIAGVDKDGADGAVGRGEVAAAKLTGAACTRFCVKTPAAAAGRPETIRARSSFSAVRIPA